MMLKLDALDSSVRVLAPTTSTKLAARMLATVSIMAAHPLRDIYCSPALDILLALHVAEEDALYPSVFGIVPNRSMSPAVAERWVNVLVNAGLVQRRSDTLALSDQGYKAITALLSSIFEAQRELD